MNKLHSFLILKNHTRNFKYFLFVIIAFSLFSPVSSFRLYAKNYQLEILKKIHHPKPNFTQGLFYTNNTLYESTGKYNGSTLKKYNLKDKVQVLKTYSKNIFAEGITIKDNFLIQLTWTNRIVFVYDLNNIKSPQKYFFEKEGWGITHDDDFLIVSDGSAYLYFCNFNQDPFNQDPSDKQNLSRDRKISIEKKMMVHYEGLPMDNINAMTKVGDFIYANIWHQNYLAVIDISTGMVVGKVDCTTIVNENIKAYQKDNDSVLNGIALVDYKKKEFLLTGKNWEWLYWVSVVNE